MVRLGIDALNPHQLFRQLLTDFPISLAKSHFIVTLFSTIRASHPLKRNSNFLRACFASLRVCFDYGTDNSSTPVLTQFAQLFTQLLVKINTDIPRITNLFCSNSILIVMVV